MSSKDRITAGFIPLSDSAILVAAQAFGFAEAEDIELELVRETSWANIRDRMAIGHFDAAHMLAPMPIAANLGLISMNVPLIAPLALGLGGNAVTVSASMWASMKDAGAGGLDPQTNGKALADVVADRNGRGDRPRFAVVHPHSGHNLELRYWLSRSGIDPERDIEIVIVPPPLMADAIGAGQIDGYCVGEPWNSVAASAGTGRIVTVKSAIWRSSPEKVLGVRTRWAEQNPELLTRLLRALYRAAQWCGRSENHQALAERLSHADMLSVSGDIILRGLAGVIHPDDDEWIEVDDFFIPFERAATFPWQSHALWFYSQMVRWGQVEHSEDACRLARLSFRPELYRTALQSLDVPIPGANSKVEGALSKPEPVGSTSGILELGPDGFFDGEIFDPDAVVAYIHSQAGN